MQLLQDLKKNLLKHSYKKGNKTDELERKIFCYVD